MSATRVLVTWVLAVMAAAMGGGPVLGQSEPATRSVTPDFNGDGFADLAIGAPFERSGGIPGGAVHVLYGSSSGLAAIDDQVWNQESPGIPDASERIDAFGWSLATGDFDGDGFDDLAVGARREDIRVGRLVRNTGSVTIIHGSPVGLTGVGAQLWHQDIAGVLDRAETGDQYGWSLVAGDFNGDAIDDLAVSVQFEDLPCGDGLRCTDAGAVNVLYGTLDGLTATGNQLWSQASEGIPETLGTDDRFGWAMAVADFDGDGFDDLAVGAPYERYLTHRDGLVHIIRGSAQGLTATRTQIWSQGSPGIVGEPYLREQFGQSLAAGDLDGDGFGDLVVGVWFQDRCWICNEGVVHAIHGSRHGLTARGSQLWSQDSPGILDRRDPGDQFGQALAVDDFDGDGFDDLAVGTPWEDLTGYISEDQGAINLIYGTARGLRSARNQLWSQQSAGIQGRAERDDHFAEAIGTGDFDGDGDADLAVGIAWETLDDHRSGVVAVIKGTPRGLTALGNQLWTVGVLGVEGTARTGDRFGWSLSSANARSGSPRVCYGRGGGPC